MSSKKRNSTSRQVGRIEALAQVRRMYIHILEECDERDDEDSTDKKVNFEQYVIPALARHYQRPRPEDPRYKCLFEDCRKSSYANKATFIRHVRTIHGNQIPKSGSFLSNSRLIRANGSKFICKNCKKEYGRRDHLVQHLKRPSNKQCATYYSDDSDTDEDNEDEIEEPEMELISSLRSEKTICRQILSRCSSDTSVSSGKSLNRTHSSSSNLLSKATVLIDSLVDESLSSSSASALQTSANCRSNSPDKSDLITPDKIIEEPILSHRLARSYHESMSLISAFCELSEETSEANFSFSDVLPKEGLFEDFLETDMSIEYQRQLANVNHASGQNNLLHSNNETQDINSNEEEEIGNCLELSRTFSQFSIKTSETSSDDLDCANGDLYLERDRTNGELSQQEEDDDFDEFLLRHLLDFEKDKQCKN
jgi:hypothetical protein